MVVCGAVAGERPCGYGSLWQLRWLPEGPPAHSQDPVVSQPGATPPDRGSRRRGSGVRVGVLVGVVGAVAAALAIVALIASTARDQPDRGHVVRFSGHDWIVRTSDSPAAPGPNLFSDS